MTPIFDVPGSVVPGFDTKPSARVHQGIAPMANIKVNANEQTNHQYLPSTPGAIIVMYASFLCLLPNRQLDTVHKHDKRSGRPDGLNSYGFYGTSQQRRAVKTIK